MPSIKEAIKAAGFVFTRPSRPTAPEDAPAYRPNDEKVIGEAPFIPLEIRKELGWNLDK